MLTALLKWALILTALYLVVARCAAPLETQRTLF